MARSWTSSSFCSGVYYSASLLLFGAVIVRQLQLRAPPVPIALILIGGPALTNRLFRVCQLVAFRSFPGADNGFPDRMGLVSREPSGVLMLEIVNREFLLFAGAIIGFVAAVLSFMDKLLAIQDRLRTTKANTQMPVEGRAQGEPVSRTETVSSKILEKASYLFLYETSVIVAAGILLNYLGLTLSRHLHSILFLDMTGTALAAFLLGPWWGAIVALLSNSVVNWLLFPETGADVIIFPWSLVNMAGGFFWGFMARRASFSKYLRTGRSSAFSHVWFLLTFGVLGAVAMSVPGALVQTALGENAVFALNPQVAETLSRIVVEWQQAIEAHLDVWFGLGYGQSLGWTVVNWLQTCIRYIPDKTMSAAIALVVLKYGYPLFERELIHGGPNGGRPGDERVLPLVLGLLYAPVVRRAAHVRVLRRTTVLATLVLTLGDDHRRLRGLALLGTGGIGPA
ncbi:MAG: hypothetical protein KatS3mg082_1203 [Nitrospiraceae bacterium]|nr:MAG: hypothetical protein KatS3mg082_1203 [Nitrospiraceae bacterium]